MMFIRLEEQVKRTIHFKGLALLDTKTKRTLTEMGKLIFVEYHIGNTSY